MYVEPGQGQAKMRAEREHPRIDVAQFNNPYAIRAWEEGLIAELKPSDIPNLDRLHDWGKIKAGGKTVAAAMYMIDLGIAYRTDKIKRKITSWNDLWDPAFKRRVGLNDITNFGGRTLVLAAKLAGGDERNIEPGFKNLNRLGSNLRLLYPNPQLMDKGLASGEVWIGAYFYSAADRLRKEGKPIAYVAPKEGVVGSQDVFVLVKNGPNSQWAAKYIDMALGAEAQRTHTELLKLIPANREVPVSAEAAARVKGAMLFDDAYITGQFAGWKSRWDREITPLLE